MQVTHPSRTFFTMPVAQKDRDLSPAEKQRIAEHVMEDPLLHGSASLCQLLRYLVEHASDNGASAPLKEHQIATEVFGRPESFDPRLDSTVRVQTSRLRSKLAEYYATRGARDAWQIVIPKGSYAALFHEHTSSAGGEQETLPEIPATQRVGLRWRRGVMAVLLCGLVGAGLWYVTKPDVSPQERQQKALVAFWKSIFSETSPPLVVFSNAQFVGRPETGLRYLQPGETGSQAVFDQYTGVGEVIAIHELDELFRRLGRHFVLKRGQLLNWNDTKNRDLIFVGSPSENIPLRDLLLNRDFVFRRSEGPERPGDLGIVNLHPQAGEQSVYFGSKDLPIREDYALVELSRESDTAQRILFLAGTTTFGTQAAVDFVCHADELGTLLARFPNGRVPNSFSALLRVRVSRGVPLESSVVAVRGR